MTNITAINPNVKLIREIDFALLGQGKPKAGVPTSGSLNLLLSTFENEENKDTHIYQTKLSFSYFTEEGNLYKEEVVVPFFPEKIIDVTEWVMVITTTDNASLEMGYEDQPFYGFNKTIKNEFVTRLRHCAKLNRFVSRFDAANYRAKWGD